MQDLDQIFLLDSGTSGVFSDLYDGNLKKQIEKGCFALGCIYEGKPAGLLLGTVEDNTCWLDWLKVSESYRKKGIGSRLFYLFADAVMGKGLADSFKTTIWDVESVFFLEDRGYMFVEENESFLYKARINDIIPFPDAKRTLKFKEFHKLSSGELRMLNNCLLNIDGDLGVSVPLDPLDHAQQSLVCLEEDRLVGLLLLSMGRDSVNVDYAYAKFPQAMLEMMSVTLDRLKKDGYGDSALTATALNKETDLLLTKLFPSAEKTRVVQGEIFG